RHPGGEGDARGLAAGDGVEGLEPRLAQHLGAGEIHQGRADPREGDELAAVDVDRRPEARGECIGLVGAEMHGADLEKHARGKAGDLGVGGAGGRNHRLSSVMTCQWRGKPGSKTATGPSPVSTAGGMSMAVSRRTSVSLSSFGARPYHAGP